MSETGIYSLLSADSNVSGLVGTNIFPIYATQNTPAPYIVYRRITGLSINGIGGELGMTNGRFQIDVYSSTYTQAKLLSGYVKTAMKNSSMNTALISDEDFEVEDIDLYGVSMDFRIFVTE